MNKIEKLAILIEKLEEAEALLASIRNDEVWMFENTETAMEGRADNEANNYRRTTCGNP